MREVDDRKEQRGGDNAARFCRPQEGECETAQADGEVIVHVAHVENVAVGKHGDERSEEPRRTARGGVDEGEDSPEERENAEGDSEFFGKGEANDFGEIVEDEIEEDVIPLTGEIEAGGFALVDEFGEPGVVGVAAEIAGLDVGVPEARDEEKDGDERDEKNGAAGDECHCDEDSIARMGGGESPVTNDQWPVKRLAGHAKEKHIPRFARDDRLRMTKRRKRSGLKTSHYTEKRQGVAALKIRCWADCRLGASGGRGVCVARARAYSG